MSVKIIMAFPFLSGVVFKIYGRFIIKLLIYGKEKFELVPYKEFH